MGGMVTLCVYAMFVGVVAGVFIPTFQYKDRGGGWMS